MATRALGRDTLVGQTLGHYRIAKKIGAGGMGEVYCARDEHLNREVAIKVLPPGTLAGEHSRKRFRKEALALSALNHPNIATIHDFDTQQGVDFLVMEYISGITLSEKLAARPLPEKEVVAIGTQLAEGLSAAHERGVVHRDLKPGNLRLTGDGRLKILDFGLAKLRVPVTASAATESLSETQAIAGTLPYMAPEQLLGGEIDARTDIHAAGSVLYEMATGQRPFTEVESSQLIGAILRRAPQPPKALNPRVSLELERIISKCLEKEPENRYQSAKELAVDLRRTMRGIGPTQAPMVGQVRKEWAWKATAVVVGLAVLLVMAGFFLRSRRIHTLTESDTIVLADFDNKTGDGVFDDALKQALTIELGQSPFLNVLSDRKVSEALRRMERPANERLTMDVGRELCLRTGSTALVGGTISSLGSHYLVGLNAIACKTGDSLAKEQVEAESKEDVLKALNKASSKLRGRMGESLASVEKYDVPAEITTSSLEALERYDMAGRALGQKGPASSIPFLQQAIELDPNFPLAYAALGSRYNYLGQSARALEYETKAYQLRYRASERERMRISATYFAVMGELDKEIQTCELWKTSYPRDANGYNHLGTAYLSIGQPEKAPVEFQEALKIGPFISGYANLSISYIVLDRLDEARATFDQALAHGMDGGLLRQNMYLLAFLEGDTGKMEQQLTWATGKPLEEDALLSMQSDTEAYYGRLRSARDFTRRAVNSASRADAQETAAIWQVDGALREAEFGNRALARQAVTAALKRFPGRDVKVLSALALARIGDTARAQALAKELEKNYPTNTLLKYYWVPTIEASIELSRTNPSQALRYLEAAVPYELGMVTPGTQLGPLYPAYVRGQAYLLANNGTAAVTEFQKLLNRRGIVTNLATGTLARIQLARAYEISGDTSKAKSTYKDFLTLWSNADADVPILKQAKAEYEKLQ